jgi:hypothetical protein
MPSANSTNARARRAGTAPFKPPTSKANTKNKSSSSPTNPNKATLAKTTLPSKDRNPVIVLSRNRINSQKANSNNANFLREANNPRDR